MDAHDLAGCDTDTNSPSEACRWQTKFELELNKQEGDVFVSHADRNDEFLRTYSESLLSSITVHILPGPGFLFITCCARLTSTSFLQGYVYPIHESASYAENCCGMFFVSNSVPTTMMGSNLLQVIQMYVEKILNAARK